MSSKIYYRFGSLERNAWSLNAKEENNSLFCNSFYQACETIKRNAAMRTNSVNKNKIVTESLATDAIKLANIILVNHDGVSYSNHCITTFE